jgi:RIO kinase 1
MAQYITGDPRFAGVKGSRRRLIFTWAQKEYRNLLQAYEAGVRVPKPIAIEKNVLVMEYIGTEDGAAPMMKVADIKDPEPFCDEVMEQYEGLYLKAGLIHADMSEYNLLLHDGRPYIIDLGQAVDHKHPMSKEFLRRDLANLSKIFKTYGILMDPEAKAREMEAKAEAAAHAAKRDVAEARQKERDEREEQEGYDQADIEAESEGDES